MSKNRAGNKYIWFLSVLSLFPTCSATAAALCPAGYYCPDVASQNTCPAGNYCPAASTSATACPSLTYSLPMSPMCAYNNIPVVASLSVGPAAYHVCAKWASSSSASAVTCWGANTYGNLGTGSPATVGYLPGQMGNNLVQAQFPTGLTVTAMATGDTHTCVLFSNGKVSCFGNYYYGQLGNGETQSIGDGPGEMGNNLKFVGMPTGNLATAIAAGRDHSCALLTTGAVTCWGNNIEGVLGVGNSNPFDNVLRLVLLPTGKTANAIACGNYHTCVLSFPSSVYCWGYNYAGQLGVGNTADQVGGSMQAVSLPTGFTDIKAIACGSQHTCVLNSDGRIACWGGNAMGQLGIGSSTTPIGAKPTDVITPALLPPGLNAIAVSCGDSFTCALFHNGSIGCWGSNEFSQLGIGHPCCNGNFPYLYLRIGDDVAEMGSGLQLVQLPTGLSAISVSCGPKIACAVLSDRSVVCWGTGPLGIGMPSNTIVGDTASGMGNALVRVQLPYSGGPGYYQVGSGYNSCPMGTYSLTAISPTACTACPANTNYISPVAACVLCPSGSRVLSGESTCTQCAAGSFSATGTSCELCSAGSFAPAGSPVCTLCQPGSNSSVSASSCTPCARGTSSTGGSSTCTACAPGTYANTGALCSPCASGTYSVAGSSACTACATGSISLAGATVCLCSAPTYATLGNKGLVDNCTNCPANSSTTILGGIGFSWCGCDAGYIGKNTGNSLSCTVCQAGYFSSWNSTACSTCLIGTYSLSGWSSCEQCAPPDPLPGPSATWTYSNLLGGNPTSRCNWTCYNSTKTFDGFCKTQQQITERCASVCPFGQYVTNCSAAGNGTCNNCNGSCGAGTGLYNVGCGGLSNGTCVSCHLASNCSNDQYITQCPGPGWPEKNGGCESCMFGCDISQQYNEECTAINKGRCKNCREVCSANQYVVGCGGNNRKGTCSNCSYCNSTSYAKGCGGMSQGSCALCASNCPSTGLWYAVGCSENSPGDCTPCNVPPRGYILGCGINSSGVPHTCADNCQPNQYALGCGGSNPGTCTPCVSTAPPGYYLSSCEKDSPGGNIPCPRNTYSTAAGATSSSTCLNCPTNSVSEPGSTSCQCSEGSFSPSGNQNDCTYCSVGSYQNTRGATSCKTCGLGYYTNVIGSNSGGDCKACDAIPTHSHWTGVFSIVSGVVYCVWECDTDFRKVGNACVSTITVPPSAPQPTSTFVKVTTQPQQTTKEGYVQSTQKQPLTTPTVNIVTTPQPTQNSSDTSSSNAPIVAAAATGGVVLVVGFIWCAYTASTQKAKTNANARLNVKIARVPDPSHSI